MFSILSLVLLSAAALAEKVDFDEAKAGAAPSGWIATQTDSITLFDDFVFGK